MSTPLNGDMLSAASLLLAVVSAFYSAWYQDLKRAIAPQGQLHHEELDGEIALAVRARNAQAGPLVLFSCLLCLIFASHAIEGLVQAAGAVARHSPSDWKAYDPIVAAFVCLWLGSLYLACVSCSYCVQLHRKIDGLRLQQSR